MLWKKLVETALRDETTVQNIAASEFMAQQRRAYPRRENDKCISVVNDHYMPIENWSLGGVLIQGDERLYNIGDTVNVKLKYKTSNGIVEVEQDAHVVRKGRERIAMAFQPLGKNAFNDFQRVIDDDNATAFAASQV